MKISSPKSERSAPSSIRWSQSWTFRVAALATFITLCGYLGSITIAVQGIQAVSNIAYDPEVEDLLGRHLETIKELHDLKREGFMHRLQTIVRRMPTGTPPTSEEELRQVMKKADFQAIGELNDTVIRPLSPEDLAQLPPERDPCCEWLGRSNLYVGNFVVSIPEGPSHREFLSAEALKHRYQLIRATWKEEILPTFVRANIGVMVITFLLLSGAFTILARQIKRKLEELISGFLTWSEKDPGFRFNRSWSGEIGIIANQFNTMADEVEANRKKNLYLEKMSSWQIIARKMAHEIKNPLTPIQMMVSQLVRRYKGNDPEYKSLLEESQSIIVEEVAGLRRMVESFSNFAQLPTVKPEPNDLVKICDAVVELEQAAFPHHSITFQHDLAAAPAIVDDQMLRKALLNFIKNAAEACGEKPSAIAVSLRQTPDLWQICIHDNGPGIPDDLKSRIFEAYFTTKHTGPTPGMGLGLAISQKIIIDHDGDISVESMPGSTTFILSLPKQPKSRLNEGWTKQGISA